MEPSDVGMHESTLSHPLDPIEKLILHLVDCDGRCPKSEDQIQVIMFLVSEALPEFFGDRLRFEPDGKWPRSQAVDDRLRNLREEGVIDVSSCSLTDAGKAYQNQQSWRSRSDGWWTASGAWSWMRPRTNCS